MVKFLGPIKNPCTLIWILLRFLKIEERVLRAWLTAIFGSLVIGGIALASSGCKTFLFFIYKSNKANVFHHWGFSNFLFQRLRPWNKMVGRCWTAESKLYVRFTLSIYEGFQKCVADKISKTRIRFNEIFFIIFKAYSSHFYLKNINSVWHQNFLFKSL